MQAGIGDHPPTPTASRPDRAAGSLGDVRRRISLVIVACALLLVPLACGGNENKAQPVGSTEADTATTAPAADPWLTEVATAAVPEVQVEKERPPSSSDTTGVAATGIALQAASERPPIPRDGYLSAGVRTTPTGFAYANPTYFKNPLVFVVTEDDGGEWLQVEVLARPNHQRGWIKRSDVTLTTHRFHLALTKSTFTLQAFDGDTELGETKVVIGRDATFTPVGTFFVTEKIARPRPACTARGSWPPAGTPSRWTTSTAACPRWPCTEPTTPP